MKSARDSRRRRWRVLLAEDGCFFREVLLRAEYSSPRLVEIRCIVTSDRLTSGMFRSSHMFDDSAKSRNPGEIVLSEAAGDN